MENDLVVRRGGRKALSDYRERFGEEWVETERRQTGEGDKQQEKLFVRLRRLDEFRGQFEKPGKFLFVQGEEITDSFEKRPVHMNASNLREVIKPRGGGSVREVMENNLRAVQEQSQAFGEPILCHLNHPNFGWGVTAEDLAAVVEERFFEIFNGHPSVNQLGDEQHAGMEMFWDIANTIRLVQLNAPPLFGIGTDDSHNYHNQSGSTPGRGWVMVRADTLDAATLIRAMEAGEFYASSGVVLEVMSFRDGVLALAIAASGQETFTTQFLGSPKGVDLTSSPVLDAEGQPLPVTQRYHQDVGKVLATVAGRTPSYRLAGDELYVRAVVTSSAPPDNPVWDTQRKQAWTQPMGWQVRGKGGR
jgi:hypothetical protein